MAQSILKNLRFKAYTNFKYVGDITLEQVINNPWLTDIRTKTKRDRDKVKKTSKAILPSSQYGAISPTDRNAKNCITQSRDIICIDIDGIDKLRLPELKSKLSDFPDCFVAAISFSGNGIFALFRTGVKPKTEQEFKDQFAKIKEKVEIHCNIQIDPKASNVATLRFITHDPDAFVRDKPKPVIKNLYKLEEQLKRLDIQLPIYEGERDDLLTIAAAKMFTSGVPEDIAKRLLWKLATDFCIPAFNPQEAFKKYQSAQRNLTKTPLEYENEYELNAEGLGKAFYSIGIDIRYNTHSHIVEFIWENTNYKDWTPITDIILADMKEVLAKRCKITNSKGEPEPFLFNSPVRFDTAFKSLQHRSQFNPIAKYLDSIDQWDGEERLRDLLWLFFKLDSNTDYLKTASKYYLLTPVIHRALHPGIQNDILPILIGPQGCGKGTLLRSLLWDEKYYCGTFAFDWSYERQFYATANALLVESSEMLGSRRADIEAMKAFLSLREDKLTMKWEKYPTIRPRQFVIIGTTDKKSPIPPDSAGYRRFVPIDLFTKTLRNKEELFKIKQEGVLWVEQHKMQLLAEAKHLAERYIPNLLQFTNWDEVVQEYIHRDDVIESHIHDIEEELRSMKPDKIWERRRGFTFRRLINILGIDATDRRTFAFKNTMEEMGWIKKRATIGGSKHTLWFEPKGER